MRVCQLIFRGHTFGHPVVKAYNDCLIFYQEKKPEKDENDEEAESDEVNKLRQELDEKKKELEKKSEGKKIGVHVVPVPVVVKVGAVLL